MTKPDINNILDEYVQITAELAKLKNYVYELRDSSLANMNNAQSNEEKKICFNKFRDDIDQLRNNKEFIKKYKSLKKKQIEIKSLLLKYDTHTESNKLCIPKQSIPSRTSKHVLQHTRHTPLVSNNSFEQDIKSNKTDQIKQNEKVNVDCNISNMITEMLNKYENGTTIPTDPELQIHNIFSHKNKLDRSNNIIIYKNKSKKSESKKSKSDKFKYHEPNKNLSTNQDIKKIRIDIN